MGRSYSVLGLLLLLFVWLVIASCGDDGGGAQDSHETTQSSDALNAQDQANLAAKNKNTNVAPQIQILSPASGTTVSASPLGITWTAVDDSGQVPTAELSIRNINVNDKTVIMPSQKSTGSFSYAGYGALPSGDYEIQLTSSDGSLSNTAFTRIKKG